MVLSVTEHREKMLTGDRFYIISGLCVSILFLIQSIDGMDDAGWLIDVSLQTVL